MTDTITLKREVVQEWHDRIKASSNFNDRESLKMYDLRQEIAAALAAPLSPENVAKAFRETFLQALAEPPPETETTRTVDRSWAQFCAGIGDSKDAPYPGMIAAFESHYGQSFADKDWRNEASVWAQAWQAAIRAQPVQPAPLTDEELETLFCEITGLETGINPAAVDTKRALVWFKKGYRLTSGAAPVQPAPLNNYQATFNAIADAAKQGPNGLGISVKKFWESYNAATRTGGAG